MLSPSLFGGRRVLVIRNGQDARKDLVDGAAGVCEAAGPGRDADRRASRRRPRARRSRTASGRPAPRWFRRSGSRGPRAGRVRARRVPAPRRPVRRGVRVGVAGGGGHRSAGGCGSVFPAAGGHRRQDHCRRGGPVLPRPGRGQRLHRGGRRDDWGRAGRARGAPVGPARRGRSGADRGRNRRWRPYRRPGGAAGRGNPYSLANSLGMPAWKIQRAQERSRGWTPEGLVDAMRAAADCNAAVKGGGEDRGYALEQAVFAVAAARQAGGAR